MTMRSAFGLALTILLAGLLWGCAENTGNSDAPAPGQVHEPGWRFLHDSEATRDIFSCRVCHGVRFQGSGPVPACTDCHIGGPPFVVHPERPQPTFEWSFPANHGDFATRDIQSCQGCHGEPGGPGSNPRFNVFTDSDLEAGCESAAGCHSNAGFEWGHNPNAAHPAFDPNDPTKQDQLHWYGGEIVYTGTSVNQLGERVPSTNIEYISHYNAGNLAGACSLCHGADLRGGVGPSCLSCHVTDPAADPTRCFSCHGRPVRPPAQWLTDVGRSEPLDPVFLDQVVRRAEVVVDTVLADEVTQVRATRLGHLQHDALPPEQRDEEEDCRVCHTEPEGDPNDLDFINDPNRNVNKHHLVVGEVIPPDTVAPFPEVSPVYICQTCHAIGLNPDTGLFDFIIVRACGECHTDLAF